MRRAAYLHVMDELTTLFDRAARTAADHRAGLGRAPVTARSSAEVLRGSADVALRDQPTPADQVIDELVDTFGPGLVGTAGPRFFGLCGRTLTNSPSDMWRPRTSWKAKMKPSFSKASEGPSPGGYRSVPYGATV